MVKCEQKVFIDDAHLTANGNQIIAKEILKLIKTKKKIIIHDLGKSILISYGKFLRKLFHRNLILL